MPIACIAIYVLYSIVEVLQHNLQHCRGITAYLQHTLQHCRAITDAVIPRHSYIHSYMYLTALSRYYSIKACLVHSYSNIDTLQHCRGITALKHAVILTYLYTI